MLSEIIIRKIKEGKVLYKDEVDFFLEELASDNDYFKLIAIFDEKNICELIKKATYFFYLMILYGDVNINFF